MDGGERIADIIIIGGLLTVLILKIVGVITIPWIWLLCPIWGLLGIGIVFAILMTLLCIISTYWNKHKEKKYEN